MAKRDQLYVKPATREARADLLASLEDEGFGYDDSWDRESVLESGLPVVVRAEERTIGRMGNVTVAACAATAKVILNDTESYEVLSEMRLP